MEHVPGKTVLQHLADRDLTPWQEHRLAEALGRLVSEYGFHATRNRDTKASNLIVREPPPDRPGSNSTAPIVDWLVVIDPDLEPAGRSEKHPLLSALAECVGTGCLPRRSVLMRVIWAIQEQISVGDGNRVGAAEVRAKRHAQWRQLEEQLVRHGDPTPRTNPLEPAGAIDC